MCHHMIMLYLQNLLDLIKILGKDICAFQGQISCCSSGKLQQTPLPWAKRCLIQQMKSKIKKFQKHFHKNTLRIACDLTIVQSGFFFYPFSGQICEEKCRSLFAVISFLEIVCTSYDSCSFQRLVRKNICLCCKLHINNMSRHSTQFSLLF